MRIIGYGLLLVLLMSGCVRRVGYIPMEPFADDNETMPAGTLYDTTRTEAKYHLKPEPYSVSSNEKDPELLGPQRTVVKGKQEEAEQGETVESGRRSSPSVKTTMTKDECISMIGSIKFERYSKRFGGERGAIKRCVILKKLKRR